jgi:hypothetical protein
VLFNAPIKDFSPEVTAPEQVEALGGGIMGKNAGKKSE